jgi:hypothetical protein
MQESKAVFFYMLKTGPIWPNVATLMLHLCTSASAQIHNIRQLTSADVRHESGHFLPPSKKLTDSNTFRNVLRK